MIIGEHVRISNNVKIIGGEAVSIGAFTTLGLPLFEQQEALLICAYGRIRIGNFCFLNFGSTILAYQSIDIGDRVLIGPQCHIWDSDIHHVTVRAARSAPRAVVLKEESWIGARTVILPGVTIGERAVVGAGSVVTKDIPPDSVAAGNPARVIRSINQGQRMEIERTFVNVFLLALGQYLNVRHFFSRWLKDLSFERIPGSSSFSLSLREFNMFLLRAAKETGVDLGTLGFLCGKELAKQFSQGRLLYLNIDHLGLQWKSIKVSPETFFNSFLCHLVRDLMPCLSLTTRYSFEREILDVSYDYRYGSKALNQDFLSGLLRGMLVEVTGLSAEEVVRGSDCFTFACSKS